MRNRQPAISQDIGVCALAVRRAIERAPLGRYDGLMHGFPRSCCKVSSQLLARYLAVNARIPLVGFVSGRRHGAPYADGGWQAHVWVEAGGMVVDITADQYDEVRVSVIATPDSAWHDTFQTQARIPYGEMMQMDAAYTRRFERMYAEVLERMRPVAAPRRDAADSTRTAVHRPSDWRGTQHGFAGAELAERDAIAGAVGGHQPGRRRQRIRGAVYSFAPLRRFVDFFKTPSR
ncbi:MAG: hypothetical protein ACI8TX_000062 [Hyphomicrobiaceae bacterium]|jgi:hypothetical protein